MKNPRNVAITGASSGLGKALALAYAKPGNTLFLHGRNAPRLEETAKACQGRGATVHMHIGDVTHAGYMEAWLAESDAKHPIDLVIANAGISAGTGIHGEPSDQARAIFATNVDGTINTIQPLLPAMLARRRGQIAIISSLAGLRGLPSCPAYSASKGVQRLYGEGLRGWLGEHGIEVSVVCPGYIDTPMTQVNDFPMPFMMKAERAAEIIVRGLENNRSRIAFPLALYLPMWILACLPVALTDPLFARLPAKPAGVASSGPKAP